MAARSCARYAAAMRMRFLVLAAIGLGSTCVLAGVLLQPSRPAGPPPLAFPALAARFGSADRIELVHAGQVLWLERRGQVWGLAQQGGYPVRPGLAEKLTDALTAARLVQPATGTPEALGLGDPFKPEESGGVYVRVLGTTGATLAALVTQSHPSAVMRRPGDPQAWQVSNTIDVPARPEDWSQHALPPLDPAQIRAVPDDGGLGTEAVAKALAGLPVTEIRPAPQAHPVPFRTVQLTLAGGSAVLTVGREHGQPWLQVSGTSGWASRLAPYAFALPEDSPLAAS